MCPTSTRTSKLRRICSSTPPPTEKSVSSSSLSSGVARIDVGRVAEHAEDQVPVGRVPDVGGAQPERAHARDLGRARVGREQARHVQAILDRAEREVVADDGRLLVSAHGGEAARHLLELRNQPVVHRPLAAREHGDLVRERAAAASARVAPAPRIDQRLEEERIARVEAREREVVVGERVAEHVELGRARHAASPPRAPTRGRTRAYR